MRKPSRLPAGLQEVEYILTNANIGAYLEIPVDMTYQPKYCKCECAVKKITTASYYFLSPFGTYSGGSANGFYIALTTNTNWKCYAGCGGSINNGYKTDFVATENEKVVCEWNKDALQWKFNNYVVQRDARYGSIHDYPFRVCASNIYDRTMFYVWSGSSITYSFEIIDGYDLHINLVPCYTIAEGWTDELGNTVPVGTKGMYDLINNVLYTNRGTTGTDFIAGPDV